MRGDDERLWARAALQFGFSILVHSWIVVTILCNGRDGNVEKSHVMSRLFNRGYTRGSKVGIRASLFLLCIMFSVFCIIYNHCLSNLPVNPGELISLCLPDQSSQLWSFSAAADDPR